MLRITLIDEVFYAQGVVFLTETRCIEDEFIRVLNFHKEAFRDKESLALMQAIDSAKRQGDYGVVTPYGESCISCLSTGCKFGLLVLFYKKIQSVKLLVEFGAAGSNVWDWLAEHIDYKMYMCRKNVYLGMQNLKNMEFEWNNITYTQDDSSELFEIVNKAKYAPYEMTKEQENKAYEWAQNRSKPEVHFQLNKKFNMMDFLNHFPDGVSYLDNELSYYDCSEDSEEKKLVEALKTFTVINYCSYIPVALEYRRHPLHICGVTEAGVKYQKVNSVKYPKFLELLIYDVLDGTWWKQETGSTYPSDYVCYREIFDSWFALVINCDESCEVSKYPQESLFGIEVDWKKKLITIYDKKQAVERFHTLYNMTNTKGDKKMLDELEFEECEKIGENSSEFKALYQQMKESYRNKGCELAREKRITDEDQIQHFVEQYMEMQAEYWIALFYVGYEKGELTQSEIVDTMKCDASDTECFFKEFEDLAKTTSIQKKYQNFSLSQENEIWKIDFSVLKTKFIDFNLEGIEKQDKSKKNVIKETKEKIEEERTQIEECEKHIAEMEGTIRELEKELQASKKVKQEYVNQFVKEKVKQEDAMVNPNDMVPDFPWNWLHTEID